MSFLSELPEVAGATVVAAMPAVCELVGACSVFCIESIRPRLQASLQYFSAGIIITAVGSELFPLLKEKVLASTAHLASIGVGLGFCLGVAFMYISKLIFESDRHQLQEPQVHEHAQMAHAAPGQAEPPDAQMAHTAPGQAEPPAVVQLERARSSVEVRELRRVKAVAGLSELRAELTGLLAAGGPVQRAEVDVLAHGMQAQVDILRRAASGEPSRLSEYELGRLSELMAELDKSAAEYCAQAELKADLAGPLAALEQAATEIEYEVDTNDPQFRRWRLPAKGEPDESTEFPWSLVAAVMTDAAIDGFLSGVAFVANPSTGLVVAGATCVENGFFGLTFSATIRNATTSRCKHFSVVAVPPICMASAGCIAGLVGPSLDESPAVFCGVIAFAMVALLWIVSQELLIEASSSKENQVPRTRPGR